MCPKFGSDTTQIVGALGFWNNEFCDRLTHLNQYTISSADGSQQRS